MQFIDGTKKIDFTKLSYSEPKLCGKSKVINVKYNNKPFMFSTPVMLTWGASDYEGNGKYELSLQFPRSEEMTPESNNLKQNLTDLHNQFVKDSLTNSKLWFGKIVKDEAVAAEKIGPILKYPKLSGTAEPDMSKEPTIRPKFQQVKEVYQCNIYDDDSNPLWLRDKAASYPSGVTPMSFFKKGMKVIALIEISGIWIINGNLHVTMKVVQAVTQKPVESVFQAGCMLSMSSADKKAIASSVVEGGDENENVDESNQIDTAVESSDDEAEVDAEEEEEEEEEPEPEPEPVKAVKKKVIKKKGADN